MIDLAQNWIRNNIEYMYIIIILYLIQQMITLICISISNNNDELQQCFSPSLGKITSLSIISISTIIFVRNFIHSNFLLTMTKATILFQMQVKLGTYHMLQTCSIGMDLLVQRNMKMLWWILFYRKSTPLLQSGGWNGTYWHVQCS